MSSKITSLNKGKAVVLLSGGLDSTVALAEVVHQDVDVVLALTVDYGQRAYAQEYAATQLICKYYEVPHRRVSLPWLSDLLPAALKRDSDAVADDTMDLMDVKRVWVPNRNGVLLNVAASFAEALGAQHIVFGANAEEAVDFPDNTQAYRDTLNASFAYSTLNKVTVVTPMGDLTKAQIVNRAKELNVPLHLIWSCYEGTDASGEHCGACPSCLRLKAAMVSNEMTSVSFSC